MASKQISYSSKLMVVKSTSLMWSWSPSQIPTWTMFPVMKVNSFSRATSILLHCTTYCEMIDLNKHGLSRSLNWWPSPPLFYTAAIICILVYLKSPFHFLIALDNNVTESMIPAVSKGFPQELLYFSIHEDSEAGDE